MNAKKDIKCSACGVHKVNHRLMFILGCLDEFLDKATYIYSPIFSKNKNIKVKDFIRKVLLNILYVLKMVKYDADIDKTTNGRSRLIWEEAKRRGIKMEQVLLFKRPTDIFRAKIQNKIIFFKSLPIPASFLKKDSTWVDNKLIFAQKLKMAGIPSPQTKNILFLKDAIKFFDNFKKPVIVKPRIGSLGLHTTTNINTKEELEKAFHLGREIALSLVMQEHITGSVCRATTVNNVLVGFFKADAPFIIGDGVKTIKELILEKNKNLPDRVSKIEINQELLNFINRQNYNIEDIIPFDFKLNLLAKTGRFYGGYTKEMLRDVHPKLEIILKKASELTLIPVAGFDLIIEDPTKDPDTQNWGIIECNSLPFIDLHYFALEGEPVNVAKNVWDLWDIEK